MSQLTEVTAKLLAAYERLADGGRINSGAAFQAYCEKWGLDHAALMAEAHARIDAELSARRVRT
jgi:nuclear transport factor 2 (NTF2) superfamily protein